ncbi:hypothetical protein Ocepr_1303 [Oceanithermus profundus DSM 14977]|uniref:Uncharacterized protein n=1 Tax=Oceanithermus profundus (strain DSM 14977 / NBRC 100410 / VKM B-2274 / 506) TaxID=670487 RepID=E4U8T0_OCEP5|nr:DUF3048 domain-containing protein [Oceanithermus profundus]ADR36760.1 hypothetical protein Ocepr_1303 [Oceanithermus profundus DSM 14977]
MTGRVRHLTPEQKRKRRAALLALTATAFLTLVFVLLVWTPTPPPPEATGYLLLELGEGAQVAGEEAPPATPEPAPEAPPLAQPPVETETPSEPSPPPEPQAAAPEEAPAPEPETAAPETPPPAETAVQPPAEEAPLPLPPAASPTEPPAPAEAVEPASASAAPAPGEAPAEPAPAPEPVPETAPEAAAAPAVATETPPAPAPEAAAPGLEPVPTEPTPAAAPETAVPSEVPPAPEAASAPPAGPAPAPVASPAAPVGAPPVSTAPGALAPPPPAPAPPAFAPAPPAPALPLAGGEPAPAPVPATSPQPGPKQGGAIGPGEKPYKLERLRPILVAVDNSAAAYPQWGLDWAVQVHEVPVEGGVTRLLVRYEGGEKGKLGPVRSARPYILRLAQAMGAVLLHVGGSPEALAMIEREKMITFDGLYDPLFRRDPQRRPPHNTYVEGGQVRQQLARLRLERKRTLSGKAYRPPEDAPDGERVEVRYAPDYVSAFRYDGQGYVWYRNGRIVRGSAPFRVTAVAVLRVDARVIDDVGRLALDLSKGHGALYLDGRRVPVTWRIQGGLVIEDASGRALDLTPYRTWFLWVPPWATLR